MEEKPKRVGPKDSNYDTSSLVDLIKEICAYNARAVLDNDKQLILFLQSWWSRTYNRPLKDPLLLTYTTEELLYEFYDKIERAKAEQERSNSEGDKIEEDKEKAVLDWAEQEEQKEIEEMQKTKKSDVSKPSTPESQVNDPANIAWMEEQMKEAKAMYGESFGEDIDENF